MTSFEMDEELEGCVKEHQLFETNNKAQVDRVRASYRKTLVPHLHRLIRTNKFADWNDPGKAKTRIKLLLYTSFCPEDCEKGIIRTGVGTINWVSK
jgi:hypothetical protein